VTVQELKSSIRLFPSVQRGKRAWHAAPIVFTLAFVCASSLPFRASGAQRRDVTGQASYDILGVGLGPRTILLATRIGRPSQFTWRFRKILLTNASDPPTSAVPSFSGTKLLVGFSSGKWLVVDLTERVTEIGGEALPPPQHRLPRQRFPLLTDGKICLLDDLGTRDDEQCTEAAAAAIHEDGRVLYALNGGQLVVVRAGGSRQELAYRLPEGSNWKLLAGRVGGRTDFLVMVTASTEGVGSRAGSSFTTIIDPRRPAAHMGQYGDPVVAELRAEIELGSRSADGGSENSVQVEDATLGNLAARLRRDSGENELSWSFFWVSPDPEIYAPTVELAPGEPDFPSAVNVWNDIVPLSHGRTRRDYEKAYASLGPRRALQCTPYVRILSYPGTWLIEYWYYYPFDEGKPHAHMHDTEHMFIEVDKLGGTVRNVFASDHDSLVPNNLYSVLVKNARPVTLPLYATAEYGKHAMAPDLDRNGRFTRGVDDNLHPEPFEVWGLRDVGKKKGDIMEPYRPGMSLPRYPEDRFALADAATLFPGLEDNTGHPVCRLQPLPDTTGCQGCAVATPEAAMARLLDHPDVREPENIYKTYVLPWREVRFGIGFSPWDGGRGQLSVALIGDFSHMTAGLVRLPARVGLEYAWTPIQQPVLAFLNGQYHFVSSDSTMYAGVRVERMVTNTQGFYFALTPEWVHAAPVTTVSPTAPSWQYGGLVYHTGYLLELPSAHKGNFTNHIGIQIQNSPYRPVLFEWRMSFGVFRQRGRHDFGARPTDRNPYE
jgi:hypothetical protein